MHEHEHNGPLPETRCVCAILLGTNANVQYDSFASGAALSTTRAPSIDILHVLLTPMIRHTRISSPFAPILEGAIPLAPTRTEASRLC